MEYAIGIDLGTTHTALSYSRLDDKLAITQLFAIPQYTDPGVVVAKTLLPSFLWIAATPEQRAAFRPLFARQDSVRTDLVIGEYALRAAFESSGHVVSSAKSWLAQRTVDPEFPILPWGSELKASEKISPVEASHHLLRHLVGAWDSTMKVPLADQRVTITVPASFDETAQELTLQAARAAGIQGAVLLEEPQAAFYAWLQEQGTSQQRTRQLFEMFPDLHRREVSLLVCDVGGGTTDFSLFRIAPLAEGQRVPRIHRVAVSEHLLLGGDNLDLKLASLAEAEFAKQGRILDVTSRSSLLAAARTVKESLLSETAGPEKVSFAIATRASSLFASASSVAMDSEALRNALVEGFFPILEGEQTAGPTERPALRQLGLHYAEDPAVSRHLLEFLRGQGAIDGVLFNGGTLIPRMLRQRLQEVVSKRQEFSPRELPSANLSTAVAHGAAYFSGLARQSTSRIRAGYPHAVLVELDSRRRGEPKPLLCVLPKGAAPGSVHRVAGEALGLQVRVGVPVSFQLFTDRSADSLTSGTVIGSDSPSLHRLAPMQTSLTGEGATSPSLSVDLEARITETGLLELHCVHRAERRETNRWQLKFNLRQEAPIAESSSADSPSHDPVMQRAVEKIRSAYAKKQQSTGPIDPRNLRRELERLFQSPLERWDVSRLRTLGDTLLTGSRGRSPQHEKVWCQLIGLFMRPGYGATLDPWRMDRLWPGFSNGLVHPNAAGNLAQFWLMWRRVAGGLDAPRQQRILDEALVQLRKRSVATPEIILTAGAMERASETSRIALAELLLKWIEEEQTPILGQSLWSLARLASRVPLYAGWEAVLPAAVVQPWLGRVNAVELDPRTPNYLLFLSQAARCTGDASLDLSLDSREVVSALMQAAEAPKTLVVSVLEPSTHESQSQAEIFGENIPPGLRIMDPQPQVV